MSELVVRRFYGVLQIHRPLNVSVDASEEQLERATQDALREFVDTIRSGDLVRVCTVMEEKPEELTA